MTRNEISEILRKHKMWIDDEEGGERANLSGADLSEANLRGANLSGADLIGANLSEADLIEANLSKADLSEADLIEANLRGANLRGANLSGADLRGANLDFSCLPLWCGSLNAEFDDKQIIQIVYHAVKSGINSKNTSDEVKNELSKLIGLANKFHRVQECGTIIA